jgi:hypothetical protein
MVVCEMHHILVVLSLVDVVVGRWAVRLYLFSNGVQTGDRRPLSCSLAPGWVRRHRQTKSQDPASSCMVCADENGLGAGDRGAQRWAHRRSPPGSILCEISTPGRRS